uniref:t-SNARE coiled-coil homology domain-containing protein n=1 Tax=Fagus sylvatica TaxID=28930 RepID=A0A2N9F0G2_FAGSY
MSLTDIIARVDAICKKYEKYDVDNHNDPIVSGEDVFARLYGVVEADTNATLQKSEAAANEKNTATAVKGLSKEELEARNDSVSALKERIEAIPDGSTTSGAKQTGGWTASTSYTGIKIDSASGITLSNLLSKVLINLDGEYIMTVGNIQNDQGLDVIIEGLDTLKNMAHDMNEEFDRQISLMDEIDDKVDRANAGLKNTNVRLKETVTKALDGIPGQHVAILGHMSYPCLLQCTKAQECLKKVIMVLGALATTELLPWLLY